MSILVSDGYTAKHYIRNVDDDNALAVTIWNETRGITAAHWALLWDIPGVQRLGHGGYLRMIHGIPHMGLHSASAMNVAWSTFYNILAFTD